MDYLKKLDDAELQYLNQFMAEYVSGAFKKDSNGEYSNDNFHKTSEERRECYTRNNTRNRCALTIADATGKSVRGVRLDEFHSHEISHNGQSFYFDDLTFFVTNQNFDVNNFSDTLIDEYGGDYSEIENQILQEMLRDYKKCLNPKTESDKKMAESNYGKMLLSKFKDIKFVEES